MELLDNMQFKLFFILLIVIPTISFAQKAQVNAIVIDAETNQPIVGASAALLSQSTKAYIRGQQTEAGGKLNFEDVGPGTYALRVTYVGLTNYMHENIVITNKSTSIELGTLAMLSDGQRLKEVVVQGKVPELRLDIDKKVFDASQSMVSVGGTASDLLANVPTLQVDMDGSVSLRGSSSVRILIDGKESAMAGSDINSLLQSLPANAIDKVELITNPSSKYDAEGQSGIINIILKKNIRTGLNGNVNVSGGSYHNYMAGATLNYRDSKFNYFGSYNFNRRNNVGSGKRENFYRSNNSQINNTEESSRIGLNNTIKLGVDYYMDDKTTFSISSNLSIRDNNRTSELFYTYFNNPQFTGTSNRVSAQNEDDLGYDINFDFSRKLNEAGSELTANFSYGSDTEDGVNDFEQTYSDLYPMSSRINKTSEDGENINLQLDYVLPLGEDRKFESGYRGIIRNSFDTQFSDTLNTIDNSYLPDYSISNDFDMRSGVHALYVNYQDKLTQRIGYQIGLRAEQADLNTTYFSKDPTVPEDEIATDGKLDYFRVYPSAFLTYQIGEKEDKVQLSYTRRVQRPRGWQVNPFENVSDDMNRRQGNPNLMPEDIHSMELSYAKFYEKWNFISSAYYRRMNDVMQPYIYRVDEETSVTYSKWENLTNSNVAGLELISKINFASWLDATWNGNLSYNKFEGNSEYNIQEQEGINWDTNLTSNLKFTNTLALQARADYFAPRIMAQGKSKYMTGVDVALRKDILNKRGSIMFNVRDLFDTRRFGAETFTPQVNSSFEHRWMKRMFTLSFSYRFGIQDLNRNKKNGDEMLGDDMGGEY